jgi:hypothetical protein
LGRKEGLLQPVGGIVKRFLFLVLAVLSPLALWAQVPNQLVTISSDGKHLVNSITGQPVFLTGDSPQLLSIMLSNADVNTYLQDRAARGFNAIWVISTDQLDQTNPPKDFFGNVPFDGAWFTNPDPAYWAHQDSVIQAAQSLGITVFLMPSFVGNNDGDVYDTPAYRASTVATIQGYGTFIAIRVSTTSCMCSVEITIPPTRRSNQSLKRSQPRSLQRIRIT